MHPTLHYGNWQISTYRVVVALAVAIAGYFGWRRLEADRSPDARPEDIVTGVFVGVLAGYGLMYLMAWLINLGRGPDEPRTGFSVTWAVLGLLIAQALWSRFHRLSIWRTFDRIAPAVALGQAIGRIGCAMAGCCYGLVTESWLGVHLPDEHGVWAVRYPTQMMSAAIDLLIMGALLWFDRRTRGSHTASPAHDSRTASRTRGSHTASPAQDSHTAPCTRGSHTASPAHDSRTASRTRGSHTAPCAQASNASNTPHGLIGLLYIALFSLKRILIAPLRASAVPWWGPLAAIQVQGLAGIAFSVVCAIVIVRRWRRDPVEKGASE